MLTTVFRVSLLVAFTAPLAVAQAPTDSSDVTARVEVFLRRPAKEQDARLHDLEAAVAAATLLGDAAWRGLLTEAAAPSPQRTKSFPRRYAGKKAPKAVDRETTVISQSRHYVFGLGIIEDDFAGPRVSTAALQSEHRRHRAHHALLGALPDIDAAQAQLLRILDGDARADPFAAFLESWRNGEESFYQALDRTAGTKDSVFFYDVMLQDFTTVFGKDNDGRALLKGLQATHDGLHEAFLTYRQYRAFREAIAWSLVLPSDVALPASLTRSEAKVEGAYSLREQAVMLLALADFDPRIVARAAAAQAAPLPEPLWMQKYDPYPSWNLAFAAAIPAMIDSAGSTDAWLQQARTALDSRAATIRTAARQALEDKSAAH